MLLLAGAAGGISALLRTPLGAALWALEVLYHDDFESDGMFPCLVSSVTAYSVATLLVSQGSLFVFVGMAAFYAGIAKVPLATIILVSELFGSYDLLVPIMFTEMIAVLLLHKLTMHPEQVGSRMDSPAHTADFTIDLLQDLHVRDYYTEVFLKTGYDHLSVIDPAHPNHNLGMLTQQQVFAAYNAELVRRRLDANMTQTGD